MIVRMPEVSQAQEIIQPLLAHISGSYWKSKHASFVIRYPPDVPSRGTVGRCRGTLQTR